MNDKGISSYRKIVKGTALFGGVQVFNILISLIRGKLIAIILGPEGMGISSLLTSSTNMLQQFSSLGVNYSAVKDISLAKENGDQERLSLVIHVLRRLLHVTSLIGSLISILFAQQLSLFAFGTIDYKWSFIGLSVMIYFTTLSNGELAILQGSRMLKQLAYSSIIGASFGLIVSVPLYYYYGYDGIVPAMIVLSLITFLFNRSYANKIQFDNSKVEWNTVKTIGRAMVALGVIMLVSSLFATISNYSLNAFISNFGSLKDVGLYQAANSITNQYVGVVFAAMGADFFPRLSGVSNDNIKVRTLVNQQSEIVMLIVTPLAILMIMTAPLMIRLLLSEEFTPLISVIRFMGVGLFFKAMAYPMGYISFAKGDKKFFFWFEGVGGNIMTLVLNIIFYYKWGLIGIGISFSVSFFIFSILYILITRCRYNFYYSSSFYKMIIPLFTLLCIAFVGSFIIDKRLSYSCMISASIVCLLLSLYGLNLRLQLIKLKQ